MKCPNCGVIAKESQKFCKGCGLKLETFYRTCSNCGKTVLTDQKFCKHCGSKLESAYGGAVQKLQKILQVSDRIEIEQMRKSLGMDEFSFYDKIYDWAAEYNFIIDGDYLIVKKDTISDFLDMLDK